MCVRVCTRLVGWPYFRNAHEVAKLCPKALTGGAPNLAPRATGRCQKLTDRWLLWICAPISNCDCYNLLHVKLIYASVIFVRENERTVRAISKRLGGMLKTGPSILLFGYRVIPVLHAFWTRNICWNCQRIFLLRLSSLPTNSVNKLLKYNKWKPIWK